MAFRVIQWGTGNTGMHSLRQIINKPGLELVGLRVYNPEKSGIDAGSICGTGPTGIRGTSNSSEIYALDADCVVYMAADPSISDARLSGSHGARLLAEVCTLLASGKNVISTSMVPLIWPDTWGEVVIEKLENACRSGHSTFRCVGIHPGFLGDALLLTLTSLSEQINTVKMERIMNYAAYNEPKRMAALGFGLPLAKSLEQYQRGVFTATYGCSVRMIANVLGVELDDITEMVEFAPAPRSIDIAVGRIEAGTVGAFRFELAGISEGKKRIVIEHTTRIDETAAPDWPRMHDNAPGSRVIIDGKPRMRMEVTVEAEDPTQVTIETCRATAALAVNSIPLVCRESSGVRTFMDLKPVTGHIG